MSGGRLEVRELRLSEVDVRIDYFHRSTDEHLQMLGVDRKRLPDPDAWRLWYQRDYALPIDQREHYTLAWLLDGDIVGFSSTDCITFGREAFMHLHIVDPDRRSSGLGTEYVRRSAEVYFDVLQLERLFCQPNAYNVAPNRTLQRAGFRYLCTYDTTPSPINFHQPVTRWVLEPTKPSRGT